MDDIVAWAGRSEEETEQRDKKCAEGGESNQKLYLKKKIKRIKY